MVTRGLMLLLFAGCSFSVEPVQPDVVDAAIDLQIPDGHVDDLTTTIADLVASDREIDQGPDTGCSSSCAGIACGQANACGTMCCAGTGCTVTACPQCQVANACGNACVVADDNTACDFDMGAGFCRTGTCSNMPAEYTVFDTQTPAGSVIITNSLELGMMFTFDRAGSVVRLRFYKPMGASGPHTGHLWSATGTLLATAAFTGETAMGWQETTLSAPVPITANTTFVVSYSEHGGFALNSHYFDVAKNAPPLHVPVAGGVFANSEGSFPTMTFQNSNYWVDVVIH